MLTRVLSVLALAGAGAIVALIGSVSHRSSGLVGGVLSLVLVAVASIFAKAWRGWWGFLAFTVTWAAVTVAVGQRGPGGGVLIGDDTLGALWLFGGAAVLAIVAAIPRRLWVGRSVAS